MRIGDPLVLFDGSGIELSARLLALGRSPRVEVLSVAEPDRESPLGVVLVQSLASGDKMDWVLQKAVELGASGIVPLMAERSVLKLDGERADKRLRRWRQIVVAACEQCGRNRIPAVEAPVELPAFLQHPSDAARWALVPEGSRRLGMLVRPAGAVQLMVGPEGGWSERELRLLDTAGCERIGLGPRVLRTETAGLAALAAMQALWGDL